VVQGQLEAYNARDIDRFLSFHAPDAVLLSHPDGEVLMSGTEAMRA